MRLIYLNFFPRVTLLENALKEKERVIEEMTIEKRNLEKIKRDQEKQVEVLRNDRDYITRVRLLMTNVSESVYLA